MIGVKHHAGAPGQVHVHRDELATIGVLWSRDGGITWHDTIANYGGKVMAVASQVPQVEIWNFQTPTLTIEDPAVLEEIGEALKTIGYAKG